MRELKKRGVAILFISHKIEEVFEIADKVTILRDGKYIDSLNIEGLSREKVIELMIGRDISKLSKRRSYVSDKKVLSVQNLTKKDIFADISFNLYEGEIIGIYGLVGAKRTDVLLSLFGVNPADSGRIIINNKEVKITSPNKALGLGIGLIPEDRGIEGLVLQMSLTENITLPILEKIFKNRLVNRKKEEKIAENISKKLGVKYSNLSDMVESLSGGNKQKIVLAKWLLTKAKVLLFDEPTKGIDVGAKVVIHQLMEELASNGIGIVMVSSEVPEILEMSDRVVVLSKGKITGDYNIAEATKKELIKSASKN
jgi:ABC-type sugar transport system ATPase subunit